MIQKRGDEETLTAFARQDEKIAFTSKRLNKYTVQRFNK